METFLSFLLGEGEDSNKLSKDTFLSIFFGDGEDKNMLST
jgi:hypothetical protein